MEVWKIFWTKILFCKTQMWIAVDTFKFWCHFSSLRRMIKSIRNLKSVNIIRFYFKIAQFQTSEKGQFVKAIENIQTGCRNVSMMYFACKLLLYMNLWCSGVKCNYDVFCVQVFTLYECVRSSPLFICLSGWVVGGGRPLEYLPGVIWHFFFLFSFWYAVHKLVIMTVATWLI